MSRDKTAVFARWAECWNARDLESGLRDCIHPDVLWIPITSALEGTDAGYRGHEGLRRWTEALFRDWESFEIEANEVVDLGEERVLVLGRWRAKGRESGLQLEAEAAWLATFRDGKVVRQQTFTDRQAALDAAGIGSRD
jgi:ketosteroid isomerase-like protein